MMDAQRFLPSSELYRRARKVEQLARVVMDCTNPGCALRDVVRATKIMTEIRAIVGEADAPRA
ncbi:hypothetical protein MU848_17645 [Sphingobium sp. MAH-33]|uniref:Uncharacterized protein n=3 Tax=Sphingomonadaceae TaxID=41297 RepID=A0ABT0E227_9SPHN|nr:hypothetical protein [Sphingobium agri]